MSLESRHVLACGPLMKNSLLISEYIEQCRGWGEGHTIQDMVSSMKARDLAQHGGSLSWLEESNPAGCDFLRDGRSIPPALTDHPPFALFYKCTQKSAMRYVT